MHASIVATGMYVPEIEVSNDEMRERFARIAPTFVDKMEPRSGILRRFYAPDGWATSDLAVRAGQDCLARAGVSPDDVDLILVGTDSPDYITPSTSVVVQHKLGAKRAGTFDVGCACASFPTAVAAANGLMATQPWLKNVLVIGAYMMRKLADPQDPMVFLYGDGAGAALLQPSEEPMISAASFRADGALAQDWFIASGGTAEPANHSAIDAGRHRVKMIKKYPAEVNDEGWPALVHDLAERDGFAIADVDQFIFTQVRRVTIEEVMKRLEAPMEKAHMIMQKWGYTGSACIPMALHDAAVTGVLEAGQRVLLVGSGVGYNQAAVALKVDPRLVETSRTEAA